MLGNELEWVQDSTRRLMRARRGLSSDIINILEYVNEKIPRLRRGGAFGYPPANVRSALRLWYAPAGRNDDVGFRPARTYY
jgi:formylglycine-generating enzyme required for sulfatase activity